MKDSTETEMILFIRKIYDSLEERDYDWITFLKSFQCSKCQRVNCLCDPLTN